MQLRLQPFESPKTSGKSLVSNGSSETDGGGNCFVLDVD